MKSGSRDGLPTMLRIAAPIIVINVSTTLMQFVDAFMVAALGEKELAASLPAGLMFFVPIAFMMGLLGAVATFVSQALGSGRKSTCGRYGWQGIYLGCAAGAALLPLWFVAVPLFDLFGHEPEVRALEVVYFRICLFQGIPLLVGLAIQNFFIGIQRTAVLGWFAIGTTLLNVLFNWMFIFGNLGAPALGLAGAAVGTVLATLVQAIALMAMFLRGPDAAAHGTSLARPDVRGLRDMLRVGLPAAAQFGFDILSWGVALVWMVGVFGTSSLAATTIIVRYMHVSFMPATALASALLSMVGKAIGAGDPDLAARHVRTALGATMIYMCAVGALFFTFRHELIGAFSTSPETVSIGASVMICVAAFQIFDSIYIVYSHALRGAGDTLWPALAGAIVVLVVFIGGGSFAILALPSLGSLGPWLAGTAYLAVFAAMLRARWLGGKWRRIKIFRESGSTG